MNNDGAAEPLDDRDLQILDGVRDVYTTIDPMPRDMLDNIRFALAVEHLETEIARAAEELLPVATRGEHEQRLLTFEAPSMTIVVKIRHNGDGTVRIDGWLTPPGAYPVDLRTSNGTITTTSDEQGRFALSRVLRSSGYVTVRPADASRVTTPTIAL